MTQDTHVPYQKPDQAESDRRRRNIITDHWAHCFGKFDLLIPAYMRSHTKHLTPDESELAGQMALSALVDYAPAMPLIQIIGETCVRDAVETLKEAEQPTPSPWRLYQHMR